MNNFIKKNLLISLMFSFVNVNLFGEVAQINIREMLQREISNFDEVQQIYPNIMDEVDHAVKVKTSEFLDKIEQDAKRRHNLTPVQQQKIISDEIANKRNERTKEIERKAKLEYQEVRAEKDAAIKNKELKSNVVSDYELYDKNRVYVEEYRRQELAAKEHVESAVKFSLSSEEERKSNFERSHY